MIDYVADGVYSASARVLADGIYARFRWTAVAVALALRVNDAQDLAGSAATAHVATRTHANHGAVGQAVQNLAHRGLVARMDHGAWILAQVVQTCQS